MSRSILVAIGLVQFIAAIAAAPIPPPPASLLPPLPDLKRRPVNGPRKPLHDIDPDAADAHHTRVLVNGQVRLCIPRRPMRHRRRAEDVDRQMSPVRSPRGQAQVSAGPGGSLLHERFAVVRGGEGDEVFGAAEGSHGDVNVNVLYALGVVDREALQFLAGFADGVVAQEGVYVVPGVVSEEMSSSVEFVCKVASVVVVVVFCIWLDEALV